LVVCSPAVLPAGFSSRHCGAGRDRTAGAGAGVLPPGAGHREQRVGYAKTATASCPDGTRAIGTGFEITGDASDVFVTRIVPSADLSHVDVTANGSQLYGPTWGLQAYAICSSVQGATRVTDGSAVARLADTGCPPGTSVNGVGAEVLDSAGNPTISGWITELAPDESLDGTTATPDWWYAQGTTDEYGICVPDSGA
jgi:hypothetical protein